MRFGIKNEQVHFVLLSAFTTFVRRIEYKVQRVYYIDKQYQPELSEQSVLSIRYAVNGSTCCIHDAQNRLMVFKHEPFMAESPEAMTGLFSAHVAREELMHRSYKQVFITGCDRRKALVPKALFDRGRLPLFSTLYMETQPDDRFSYHPIEPLHTGMATAISNELYCFLERAFPGFIFTNHAFLVIQHALSRQQKESITLFADMQADYFDLLILRGSELLFFNTFGYQAEADVVYFTLHALRTLSCKPEEASIMLSGIEKGDDTLSNLMGKYLATVHRTEGGTPVADFGKQSFDYPYFTHLLNLHRCGL